MDVVAEVIAQATAGIGDKVYNLDGWKRDARIGKCFQLVTKPELLIVECRRPCAQLQLGYVRIKPETIVGKNQIEFIFTFAPQAITRP